MTKQWVPQFGGVVVKGPLLFLLYINDLPNYLNNSKVVLYADDTTIYHSHENIDTLCTNMNNSLQKLHTWCSNNVIENNQSKTKYMIFNTPNKSFAHHPPIILHNKSIEQVASIKFLKSQLMKNWVGQYTHKSYKEKYKEKNLHLFVYMHSAWFETHQIQKFAKWWWQP